MSDRPADEGSKDHGLATHCTNCGERFLPQAAFCGSCGSARPVGPPAAASAPSPHPPSPATTAPSDPAATAAIPAYDAPSPPAPIHASQGTDTPSASGGRRVGASAASRLPP